jgi:hypothetical protein
MKHLTKISNEDSIKIHEEYENMLLYGSPQPPKLSFVRKFLNYLKFECSSIFEGEVSTKIFNYRKSSCLTCVGLKKTDKDSIGFCGLCGCKENPRSALSVKLTIAGARCPIGKWGIEKGRPNLKNIPKVAIGICRTLWYNVSQLWQRN